MSGNLVSDVGPTASRLRSSKLVGFGVSVLIHVMVLIAMSVQMLLDGLAGFLARVAD